MRHVSASAASTGKISNVSVGGVGTTFKTKTSDLDRTPNAFSFGTKTDVTGGTEVVSDVVTLDGFNTGIAIIPGPGIQYRIGSGDWMTGNGTLPYTTPGTTLTVKHTATTTASGYTKTYLKVGGVTGYFTTRTR